MKKASKTVQILGIILGLLGQACGDKKEPVVCEMAAPANIAVPTFNHQLQVTWGGGFVETPTSSSLKLSKDEMTLEVNAQGAAGSCSGKKTISKEELEQVSLLVSEMYQTVPGGGGCFPIALEPIPPCRVDGPNYDLTLDDRSFSLGEICVGGNPRIYNSGPLLAYLSEISPVTDLSNCPASYFYLFGFLVD